MTGRGSRFVVDVRSHVAGLLDTEDGHRIVRIFGGAGRLAEAHAEAARLNAPAEPGTLRPYALRQRREDQLAEVTAIERTWRELLLADRAELGRVMALRKRLEASLRVLSATESAETASLVGQDTLPGRMDCGRREARRRAEAQGGALSKPGPY